MHFCEMVSVPEKYRDPNLRLLAPCSGRDSITVCTRFDNSHDWISSYMYPACLKIAVFGDVAPCSLVEIDRRFRGAYCLHHHDDRRQPSSSSSPWEPEISQACLFTVGNMSVCCLSNQVFRNQKLPLPHLQPFQVSSRLLNLFPWYQFWWYPSINASVSRVTPRHVMAFHSQKHRIHLRLLRVCCMCGIFQPAWSFQPNNTSLDEDQILSLRPLSRNFLYIPVYSCLINTNILLSIFWTISVVRFQVLTATSMKTILFWYVAPCSLVDTALMMEAVNTSEPSASFYHTTRRNIPQDRYLQFESYLPIRLEPIFLKSIKWRAKVIFCWTNLFCFILPHSLFSNTAAKLSLPAIPI
jgi:hypothetical protein